jgi:hypothetical protein
MWVQHVVCPAVVEEEKKDQIHDQNGGEPNRYVSSKDIHDYQNSSRVSSPRRRSRRSAPPPVALGPRGGPRSLAGGCFHVFLFMLFFNVFFEVVRWRLHLKVRIWFSLSYPRFGDVSSIDRGMWRSVSCRSPRIQSVFMFVGLVSGQTLSIYGYHHCWWFMRWPFGALGRRLDVSLLQQSLLR